MDADWLTYGLAVIGSLLLGAVMIVLHALIITLCALGLEWALDCFSIVIDRILYWTGVALLILFCTFGKPKIEKND